MAAHTHYLPPAPLQREITSKTAASAMISIRSLSIVFRGLVVCFFGPALALFSFPAAADDNPLGLYMTRQHPAAYLPGEALEVVVTLEVEATDVLLALGMEERLPDGWRFVSVRGYNDEPPPIQPEAGTGPVLEFAWIAAPRFPYTFAYTVMIPETEGGPAVLEGFLFYRTRGGPHSIPSALTELQGPEKAPPTLTLRGDNPMKVVWRSVWREPGYTALDHNQMDISARVVVTGEVNTEVPGEYRITYSVSAENNSQTTKQERVVEVAAPPAVGAPPAPLEESPLSSNPAASPTERRPFSGLFAPAPANAESKPARIPPPAAPTPPNAHNPEPMVFPDLSAYRPVSMTAEQEGPPAPAPAENETPPTPPTATLPEPAEATDGTNRSANAPAPTASHDRGKAVESERSGPLPSPVHTPGPNPTDIAGQVHRERRTPPPPTASATPQPGAPPVRRRWAGIILLAAGGVFLAVCSGWQAYTPRRRNKTAPHSRGPQKSKESPHK